MKSHLSSNSVGKKSTQTRGAEQGAPYLNEALLAQLYGAGFLEEVRAEVEAQLEGEADQVDALHLFLREGVRGTVWKGWQQGSPDLILTFYINSYLSRTH